MTRDMTAAWMLERSRQVAAERGAAAAVEAEQANWDRHVAEQTILVARFHPRHFPQFVEAMAYRKAAHEARLADLERVHASARN